MRLALEASESLCVFGNIVRQELQSHKAVEFYVLRLVNRPNAGASQLLQLRVLRFGFFQDGDVGVGVFPEGEEIFVGGESASAGPWRLLTSCISFLIFCWFDCTAS